MDLFTALNQMSEEDTKDKTELVHQSLNVLDITVLDKENAVIRMTVPKRVMKNLIANQSVAVLFVADKARLLEIEQEEKGKASKSKIEIIKK